MAILGFSHITSEVADIEASVEFYKLQGFELQFTLQMSVPSCKKQILRNNASEVKLAYLIFKNDKACNLELIEHNSVKNINFNDDGRISLCFFTAQTNSEVSFIDLDRNQINIFPLCRNSSLKAKHYIMSVKDINRARAFYKKNFGMGTDNNALPAYYNKKGISSWCSLTFKNCLLADWDGYLHLVEKENAVMRKHYLDEIGFHSFCFLISNTEKDIYAKVDKNRVVGPIIEDREIKGKRIVFEVGFTHDPNGYPIEYLLLNQKS